MRTFNLPSGAVLTLRPASFEVSKNLYQAILDECKNVHISTGTDMASVFKDFACISFSSKKIENCLWECFKVCQYDNGTSGNLKIDKDTFEPVSARDDFMVVCVEVAKENVLPFMKSLYAEYAKFLKTTQSDQP